MLASCLVPGPVLWAWPVSVFGSSFPGLGHGALFLVLAPVLFLVLVLRVSRVLLFRVLLFRMSWVPRVWVRSLLWFLTVMLFRVLLLPTFRAWVRVRLWVLLRVLRVLLRVKALCCGPCGV